MAYVSLAFILLSSFVIVRSQDAVMCYNDTNCGGHFEMSTIEYCCDNRVAPSRLSYSNSTTMECSNCPRVFGFFDTTYSGKEREEAHSVLVGTISGPTPSSLNVTVELDGITAGEGDIVLSTTDLTFSAGRDPLLVSFMFIQDSIPQEMDERFTLTLTLADAIEGYELHLVLNGTILDDDRAIRLQGGTATSGRVEVYFNNIWGTVCDEEWETADAQVVCRELGYPAIEATTLTASAVPDGTGQIWLENVNCVGDEISLFNCGANPIVNHNCDHSEDVGVSCQIRAIRLRGGTATSGRVEVYFNNIWGTVCDDGWGPAETQVACRQLGYSAIGATAITGFAVPDGTGKIWLDELNCIGNEDSLLSCGGNTSENDCSHSEDVGVSCEIVTVKPQEEVMCYNGTSCGGYYEMSMMEDCCDNDVAPTGLSYRNSTTLKCNDCPKVFGFFQTTYSGKEHERAHSVLAGTISGPTLSSLNVTVELNRITAGVGDITLVTTSLAFSEGRNPLPVSFMFTRDSIPQEADERFNLALILTEQIEGYELYLVLNGTILDDERAIRLQGRTASSGRVEIYFNNAWGTVCDHEWRVADAQVACRELGYSAIGASTLTGSTVPDGTGQIWLDDVDCIGNETSLFDCSANPIGDHDCDHSKDVGVLCQGGFTPCSSEGEIRLQGGTVNSGRLEICYNSIWGTVCDDGWGAADAQVACRELGYPATGASTLIPSSFPHGSGQIWLDEVACVGNEITLSSCRASYIGQHDCSNPEDVGVRCEAGGTLCSSQRAIRLQGGTATSGRVEVCNNNVWGTVCDNAWGDADAKVACRQLGYSAIGATALTGSTVPDGTERIWLSNVNCVGNEMSLFSCSANLNEDHSCLHFEDAGVSCQAGGTPCISDGDIRLQGGTATSGRVEVCNNNVWGTVCDDEWEDTNAQVACRQLGYSTSGATTFYASTIPDGTGQIWLDNVNCVGNEITIFNCNANPIGNHNCFHSEDVGVSCQATIVKPQEEVMCYNGTSCGGHYEMSTMEDCCDNDIGSSGLSYRNSTTMECNDCPSDIVKSEDEVMCYNDTSCSGHFEMSLMEDCCDNSIAPFGLSYNNSTAMECSNCLMVFGFFDTTYSGKECGEAHSVLAGTISGPSLSPLNVTVALNRITAGVTDLVLSTTDLTFSAGRDPLPVSFMFIQDSISQEVNETFTLTLTFTEDIEGYELHLVLNGTILDDDIAGFKLSKKEYREDEKPNAMMSVKITKEQNMWLANPVTFRVSPLTIDGAMSRSLNLPGYAVAINFDSPVQADAEDFNTTTFTVEFPSDEGLNMLTEVDAFIAVVDDEVNENREQLFIVFLEVINATDISLVDNTENNLAICRIFDNDPLAIGFEQPEYYFREPQHPELVQVSLVKDCISEQTFRVAITVLTGNSEIAASNPADFKASNLSILYPPTTENIDYTFSILPDEISEGLEQFIAISSPSESSVTYRTPDQTTLGVFQFTAIYIKDNQVGLFRVGFERRLYSVNESAMGVQVCVIVTESTLSDSPTGYMELLIVTILGSADMDDFLYGVTFNVIIRGDEDILEPHCFIISIIDNNALEDVESFTSNLHVIPHLQLQETPSIIITPDITTINILDDDDAVIGFINAPYIVNEFDGVATMTVGVLDGSSIQTDVVLSISLFNGSAGASFDYLNDLSNDGIIVLNASNPKVNISFSLVDDSIVEALENLSASLIFSGAAHPRVTLDPPSVEIIILGDDDPIIGFLNIPYIVNEYDRKVTLIVAYFTDDTSIQVFLSISLISGTANVSSDYLNDLSGDGNVTLHAGTPIEIVSFSLVDDSDNEIQEHLSASLKILKPTDSPVSLAHASADVIILGDEVPTVGFKKRKYFVDEYNCCVTMEVGFVTDGKVFPTSLLISLVAETANVSTDYLNDLNNGGIILLNASHPTVNISFSIVDDSVIESLETLSANMSFSDGSHENVVLGPASALIYIHDNDEIAYGFEETKYSVNESAGILEVCCGVTNFEDDIQIAISITVEFNLATKTGSADDKDFKDLDLATFNLTIFDLDPGEINSLRMCFNIVIIDDGIREENESFMLEISAPPHVGIITSPNVTVISILDNNDAEVGFIDATYYFGENDLNAFLQFGVLSEGLQINVSVQFNFSQESTLILMAGDGHDIYVLNAEQPSINISFTLVNDNIYELTKLLVANLSFVGDRPARVTITPDIAQIYILDDEVLDFRFDPEMYSIAEEDANVTLNICLFSGNLGDIGVILRASIVSSSIFREFTFQGNDTFKLVKLPIMSNIMAERQNDLKVKLSFINYTNGNIEIQDKERIHLGGNAQITILSPLPIGIIIGPILGAVAFFIVGAVIYLLYRLVGVLKRKRKFLVRMERIRSSSLGKDKELDQAQGFKLCRVQSSFKLNIAKHLMINSCNLKMYETVGQGQFGIVYRGRLSKGINKDFTEVVAVKTLKGFLDQSLVRSLLEECSRMSTFDHPNVLTLIGVCVDGGPVPYIVMPFMFNGSLISYLTKERDEFYLALNSEMNEKVTHASCKLMDYCLQIANGMKYLTSNKIIHRDLAARNCMVDLHFVVKVSDFGLSEQINPSKDYFRQQEQGVKLPFKWMAPESLEDGIFSEKTDVWSYGVTCWEVFSAGRSPYSGVNPTDLCSMLQSGYRMEKPNNAACPDILYTEVIEKCWESKPEKRPNFSYLVTQLSLLLEANAEYVIFSATTSRRTTATADTEHMEKTASECGDNNTIHVMETADIDNGAGYGYVAAHF